MNNQTITPEQGKGREDGTLPNKLLMLLIACILFCTPQAHAQYVRAQGTQIVDENGQPIFFSGMNLGNWLLWEGYLMMGDFNYRTHTQFFNGVKDAFGGNLDQAIEFEHQWRMNYVNEQSIIDLKNQGFNSVRVPFHFNLFWDYNSSSVSNRGFQYIDRLINFCRTHDMYVLLDMHAAPGYQNPGDHSDNNESDASQPRETVHFWDGNNVNIASQVWRHIADHYKNEPVVWGYDLINEPVPQPGREYELLPSLITMRNAIREVDNNHIIVAEGSWWGSDMQKLDWEDPSVQSNSGVNYRWDNNLVYQTHHYSSDVSALNGRKALTDRLNVPLILGEYGENTNNVLREMTDWCINNNVGYFPWSFKKMYHDRCIWTINPNGGYNAVRDFIQNGGNPPSNAYNDMISFCQNNIGNGSPGITFHQEYYDAVKYTGSNNTGCTGSYAIMPGTLQAEDHCSMDGIQMESTSDTGGGQNVGWIDAGDWMGYRVDIPSSGNYSVEYRVASPSGGGSIQLEALGGGSYGSISVPATGGWQSWTTISHTVSLNAGQQEIALNMLAGGFNINWFAISSQGGSSNAPLGQTIWLRGSNGQYVSSENGQSAMMCNRPSVGGWEIFTVEGLADGKVALKGSNGQYVSSMNGQSAMVCDRPSVGGWEAFDWVDLGNNTVALLGFNGQYVSSEDGQSGMMCDRPAIGGWETFTWGSTGGARLVEEAANLDSKGNMLVYPNPVTDFKFTVDRKGNSAVALQITLSDLSGKEVHSTQLQAQACQVQIPHTLSKGLYILNIDDGTTKVRQNLIIK